MSEWITLDTHYGPRLTGTARGQPPRRAARLFEGGDRSEALGGRLTVARARVADTAAKIERINDAMLADDAVDAPAALKRRARELETPLAEQEAEADALERELVIVASSPTPTVAKVWADLQARVNALDHGARTKAVSWFQTLSSV
ncbi:hypothetical protein [Stenotrophomonas lactitubi]|uniref:hypothetical protein n=1 Tax=Stenotrophomonas lactitubi TaxID=2045214 RepID=UPI00320AE669